MGVHTRHFNVKIILALFGFFVAGHCLKGRNLKSCIDTCPVENRYRACVLGCLSARQQGQGGGQNQNQNNPAGIHRQQGGVQTCQGTRCIQNNPAAIKNQEGKCPGPRCPQNNQNQPAPGVSISQHCSGSRCAQNNLRVPPSVSVVQECIGSQCTRTDSSQFGQRKSSIGNRNDSPFKDCFPFCDE